jgi:glycerol kinase
MSCSQAEYDWGDIYVIIAWKQKKGKKKMKHTKRKDTQRNLQISDTTGMNLSCFMSGRTEHLTGAKIGERRNRVRFVS